MGAPSKTDDSFLLRRESPQVFHALGIEVGIDVLEMNPVHGPGGAQPGEIVHDRWGELLPNGRMNLSAQAKVVIAPYSDGGRKVSQQCNRLFEAFSAIDDIAQDDEGVGVSRTQLPHRSRERLHLLVNVGQKSQAHRGCPRERDQPRIRPMSPLGQEGMCKRFIALGLAALLFGIFVAAPAAADPPKLDGHWEGIIAQPAGALEIAVDFTTLADSMGGTFSLPAAAVFRWPLSIRRESSGVSLKLPNGLALDGELRGSVISGTVHSPTGGHTDIFRLKRTSRPPLPYKQEEVSFQSDGVTLTGTLRVPLSKGRHPAVCLLTGSGGVDREGESFYADYFARHGIATLVYDKRGTGKSGGDFRDESFDDEAADALAGIHFLQHRSGIDLRRTGLYGRSHGGMVIPLAAAESKDVAFIINIGGAGVSPYQQVTYQLEAQMRHDGFSEAEIAEAVAYVNLKWEVARTGGEGWDKLQAATQDARDKKWLERAQPPTKLEDIVPSWKLQMGYDPMPALARVKCPILAVFGELDTYTPVTQTIANYRTGAAKSGNRDCTLKVFPNADHSLLVWPKPNDPAHWPVLAAGYLDTMKRWIDRRYRLK